MKTPRRSPRGEKPNARMRWALLPVVLALAFGLVTVPGPRWQRFGDQLWTTLGLPASSAPGRLGVRQPSHQLKADVRTLWHALEYVLQPEPMVTNAPQHEIG